MERHEPPPPNSWPGQARWIWPPRPCVRAAAVATGAFAGAVALAESGYRLLYPAAPPPWHWGAAAVISGLVAVLAGFDAWAAPVLLVWLPIWPPLGVAVAAAVVLAVLVARRPRGRGAAVVLGWRNLPLPIVPVVLDEPDRLLHLHVLGPTGSGKSTSVLAPLMRQDVERGIGFTLVEPKGDLAHTVRRQLASRPGRLVIPFDPTDRFCPHLNPLAGPPAAAAEGLALALDQLEPDTPGFYRTVSRVLLVQAVQAVTQALGRDADLLALLRFLRSPDYRSDVLSAAGDAEVAAYFRQEWGGVGRGRQLEWQMGLINRLRSFLLHPGLRRALTPPYDFTVDDAFDGAWLLATLPAGDLGLGARATGTLLWHLAVAAALRHGPHDRLRHTLYLDEFHQYVTPDLTDVLAMVRGYGLAVVLAHQDMGQLTPALKEAVDANARTRILLAGTSAQDIERFTRAARPRRLESPRYAPRGRATIIVTRGGRLTPPVVARLPKPRRPTGLDVWDRNPPAGGWDLGAPVYGSE
jgi:hypothetical protein